MINLSSEKVLVFLLKLAVSRGIQDSFPLEIIEKIQDNEENLIEKLSDSIFSFLEAFKE